MAATVALGTEVTYEVWREDFDISSSRRNSEFAVYRSLESAQAAVSYNARDETQRAREERREAHTRFFVVKATTTREELSA